MMMMFKEYIDSMPLANTPEVFGLHPNAEIGYYTSAAKEMWSHLIDLQPQTGKSTAIGPVSYIRISLCYFCFR